MVKYVKVGNNSRLIKGIFKLNLKRLQYSFAAFLYYAFVWQTKANKSSS